MYEAREGSTYRLNAVMLAARGMSEGSEKCDGKERCVCMGKDGKQKRVINRVRV